MTRLIVSAPIGAPLLFRRSLFRGSLFRGSLFRATVIPMLALGTLLLAGCGQSMEARAVASCEKAIGEKLTGKTFVLDKKDMLAKAKHDGEDIIQVSSFVVFDQGLPSESKQGVDCRAEFNAKDRNADPAVVGLNFTW